MVKNNYYFYYICRMYSKYISYPILLNVIFILILSNINFSIKNLEIINGESEYY